LTTRLVGLVLPRYRVAGKGAICDYVTG
jgi:hypothetical protein